MKKVNDHIDGVAIGIFLGFDGVAPLVVYPGNPHDVAVPARSLVELRSELIGKEVALLFEGGNPSKPLIVGRLVEPRGEATQIVRDGELVRITANERIELRCGKAVILLEKDGRITIRGTYVTSQASANNRIRGGSIDLN